MSFKIEIKNIDKEFEKLINKKDKFTREELLKESLIIKKELQAETPIDTGLARDSWKINQKFVIEIENTTPYIQFLNEGSSLQAPSHFIEKVLLKRSRPIGSMVKITNAQTE